MTDRQGVSFHSPPGGQLSAAVDTGEVSGALRDVNYAWRRLTER
jgi:hypothetical protein